MPAAHAHTAQDVAAPLRLAVTRLARVLRHQDESGLTPTLTAVLATVEREGPLTLGALAQAEHLSPASVTSVIGKLEAEGYVARLRDDVDRRVCRVEVTPSGRSWLDANRRRRTAWLATQLRQLPAEDVERLAAAIPVIERLTEAAR